MPIRDDWLFGSAPDSDASGRTYQGSRPSSVGGATEGFASRHSVRLPADKPPTNFELYMQTEPGTEEARVLQLAWLQNPFDSVTEEDDDDEY